MSVYVVVRHYQYEGGDLVGVYATLDEAQAVAVAHERGDWVTVTEVPVGSSADDCRWWEYEHGRWRAKP